MLAVETSDTLGRFPFYTRPGRSRTLAGRRAFIAASTPGFVLFKIQQAFKRQQTE
jgi:hypothetical protein